MTRREPYSWLAFAILLCIVSYLYFAVPDCLRHRTTCFGDTTLAPMRYRVLVPTIENAFVSGTSQEAVLLFDFALQAILTTLLFIGLYRWLKRWQSDDKALLGCFALALLMVVSFHYFMRSMATTFEILFVVMALLLLDRDWKWTTALTVLACLNRETGLLFPAIYLAYHGHKAWKEAVGILMTGSLTLLAIHLALGSAPHVLGLEGTLAYNEGILPEVLFANLPFIPVAALVITNYRQMSPVLKRWLWVVLGYVLAVLVGGAWDETQRLLLPIMPLMLVMV